MQKNKNSSWRITAPAILILLGSSLVWLIFSSLHPSLPQADESPRLYSNQCQQDLRLIYVNAIRQARQSIYLIMFGLNDPAVIAALRDRSQHIPTAIYYDPSESLHLRSTLRQADLHPVQLKGLMHQKILIVDGDLVLIGSANMTSSSLLMHDNLVVGMRSSAMADFLAKQHFPAAGGCCKTVIGGQEIELWLLPDPQGSALAHLRRHIRNAAHSVKIAIFTLTHPGLCDEIIAAHQRHIDVTVVIDLHSGLGASAQAVERLQQNGINVLFSQGVQLLHHKFVWIDEKTLLCGSANWTKAAFEKNSDCILVLSNLSSKQKRLMDHLWNRIQTEAANPKEPSKKTG